MLGWAGQDCPELVAVDWQSVDIKMNEQDIHVAIACGGSGGHLFPGIAVAEKLRERGCSVTLFISEKEVDQRAVQNVSGVEIVTTPAVGLEGGKKLAFAKGLLCSYRTARTAYKKRRPAAALAMGGFTSAAPLLAARCSGAKTFLHESNSVPGRANRLLSRGAHHVFIGFDQAAKHFRGGRVTKTGTPVRSCFQWLDPQSCRQELGLNPKRPVVLVVGGSQGASGLNRFVLESLPLTMELVGNAQFLHLAGSCEAEKVRNAYKVAGVPAVVHPFFDAMEVALGAATVAVSRAGASCLAELAAMRLPAILVPFPEASNNHQLRNAEAFVNTGAARLLEQRLSTPEMLARSLAALIENDEIRARIQAALAKWEAPAAAEIVANAILDEVVPPRRGARRPVYEPMAVQTEAGFSTSVGLVASSPTYGRK
ncbi:MAG TPA: undecaprenyldiphospho-muramoylpentapeptide beta-N-acetylglucosaminyltransferase [Candidatus Dormibacteraeota bacterium]|nr:undecaprenyldiphospho-muramoylpentapeptide beta-N-acetylglucosaminyltransferase [Candidatus Dormibacteraeota bacterium]